MDLDSLTKLVQEKTGLDEEKAKLAVTIVLNQVKSKLPAPAQGYVDQLLGGEGGAPSSVGDMLKDGLGGLMG